MKPSRHSSSASRTTLFLLPVSFFFAIPLLFIKENIREVERLDPLLLPILLGLTMGSTVLLFCIRSLIGSTSFHRGFTTTVDFICYWVITAGFFVPVSTSTGMVDPGEVPVHLTNFLLTFLSAGALAWLAKGKHRRTLHHGTIIFLTMNVALSAFALTSKFRGAAISSTLSEISDQRNVLVVSFDGISGSAAREILLEDQELSRRFAGFTLFSHAAASSPATEASIATSLYGNKNFKARYRTTEELWDSSPADLLTNHLQDRGYLVSTFGAYNTNFKERGRHHSSSVEPGLSPSEVVAFTAARTLTSRLVPLFDWVYKLEHAAHRQTSPSKIREISLLREIASSKSKKWKRTFARTLLDWEKYHRDITPQTSVPVAHFLHFTFTHFPVEFDRDCRYQGGDLKWLESRQNRFGAMEETRCALTMLADYVSTLKELGVFENSMVILKSDHGKPISYYERESIEARRINGQPTWGYGRYAPLLAIKGFGPNQTALEEDPSPVVLDDLARTICEEATDGFHCEKYPGFNLLDEDLIIPETSTITLFVPRSTKSSFRYETHLPIEVKRQGGILPNLHALLSSRPRRGHKRAPNPGTSPGP